MTKTKLLIVSLLLVCGLVAMAPNALATAWGASANVRPYDGRVEGFAEATGQVVLSLSSGSYGTVPASATFTITYSAPLAIDAPHSVVVVCSGKNTTGTPGGGISPWLSGCGSTLVVTIPTPYSVQLEFPANTTFYLNDGSQVSVTVRVNATGVSCGGAVSANVTAYSPNPSQELSLPQSTVSVGAVLDIGPCPSLSLGFDSYKAKGYTTADVLTCIGVKDVASYENDFILNVDENFAEALTSDSAEWALDAGGDIVLGIPPPSVGSLGTDVTNGSNFIVTFSQVPQQITIKATAVEPCSTLSPSDPLVCPGGKLNAVLISPAIGVWVSPGTVKFTYEVTSIDAGSAESLDLDFKFWSHGPLPPGITPNSVTVNVAYSPTIQSPLPIPYFTGLPEEATALTVIQLWDCDTNLLYPFVTNFVMGPPFAYNNLGTTVIVANTTVDPLASAAAIAINPQEQEGTAVPQSGTCTFWMFPSVAKAFADGSYLGSPVSWTSGTIYAGGVYGFDMGSTPAAGMTGYMWAKCKFQNAHGIAWVTDGYGVGEPGLALTVPAIVIPTPEFYHRSPAGDGLGESAVAPIAVSKFVEKQLFYGVHNGAGH